MKVISPIIFSILFVSVAYCEDRANLMLRAFVPPTMNTKVVQTQLSSSKSLVTVSSQGNSKHMQESQKFEVEGLDQDGMEGQVKSVEGLERTVQYELLINHIKTNVSTSRPVFLKISAN